VNKLLLFVLSGLLLFVITVFFRLGGHKPVNVSIIDKPEFHLLYKEHIGAYHKINDIIVSAEVFAAENNWPCGQTFGEYLDDPRLVDERRLRSLGGCILPFAPKLPASRSESSDEFKVKTVPARSWVMATFAGAPSISPLKVYPRVQEFMEQNNLTPAGAVIEIYTIHGDRKAQTEYLFPY